MSKELVNIIKILLTAFILTFVWHNAVAEEEVIVIEIEVVSTPLESVEPQESTEEEPDCE